MKTKEKIALIKKLITDYQAMDAISDQLNSLLGVRVDSPAMNPFWQTFDHYVKVVAQLTGDTNAEWLCWFIWENNCGKKEMKAGYDKKLRAIKTVKQLVNLINEGEKNE